MRREAPNGVVYYQFEALDGIDGLFHAVLTRVGGVSRGPYATLNLGHTVGDDPQAVDENHRRGLAPLGLDPGHLVSPWQVHGSSVAIVGQDDLGTVRPETDALLTTASGVPLMMRFGDCAPVLLCDPVQRVVGMAHAGWRGIVAGVVEATVRTMTADLGSDAGDIWAGVGPTIGPCCYEVGGDVADQIAVASPAEANVVHRENGRVFADLPAAVEGQLRAAGVNWIEQSGLCTACRVHEFFSHRAENGRTGRFGVVIGFRSD